MAYYPSCNGVFDTWRRASVSIKITILSLLIVFITTLYPFGFSLRGLDNRRAFHYFILELHPSSIYDVLNNILLFLPFGFGFSGYFIQIKGAGILKTLAGAIFAGFGLSYTVEILQIFLPSRTSSLTDVFSNSVGGFLGFLSFYLWEFKVEFIIFVKKRLLLIILGYSLLVFFITISLPLFTRLSNWDKTFHLLLGNERTGNRPWQGSVSEMYIADRAISKQEIYLAFHEENFMNLIGDSLLGLYQLTGNGSYRDKTGHLPDLVWQGKRQDVCQGNGILLGTDQWLMTTTPAEYLTQRISETSQFTIRLTVATADTMQSGPARIITLSKDPSLRNFTLGQEKNDLVFRLRTPLTGKNGFYPQIVVADIFSSPKPRNLIITYDGSTLYVYVDGMENSHAFEFSPISTLVSYVFPIGSYGMKFFKILYYVLVFAPIGILCLFIIKKQNNTIFK